MKAWHSISGMFLICLFGFSGLAENAEQSPPACAEMTPVLAHLAANTKPDSSEISKLVGCKRYSYEKALAHAIATFATVADGQYRVEAASVLEQIRDALSEAERKTSFDTFASALERDPLLTSLGYKSQPSTAPANFDSLKSLIELLKRTDINTHNQCDEILRKTIVSLKTPPFPSTFTPGDCPDKIYSDLAIALAPMVAKDLKEHTERTAPLINSVQNGRQDGTEKGRLSFAAKLTEEFWRLKTPLPPHVARATNDSEFINRLLEHLRDPRPEPEPSVKLTPMERAVLMVFMLLILTNSACLIYLFNNSRRRRQSIKSDDELIRSSFPLEKRVLTLEANSPTRKELDLLVERVGLIEGSVKQSAELSAGWEARLAAVETRPPGEGVAPGEPSPAIDALTMRVNTLSGDIQKIIRSLSPLTLEREALGEAWKKFRDNKELLNAAESAADDSAWLRINELLLVKLPQEIPDDLKATSDAVLAPARDYHNLISKISLIPRLVNDRLPQLGSDGQELARLRDFTTLLTMIQSSKLVADRLEFRLKPWIEDHFLTFADMFIQRYQIAQLEKREASLQAGLQIVLQVLDVAGLKPVELTLGKTRFDGTQHVGRSTSCDPRFEDGVIMSAVRNGFVQDGKQVIRQPEVIVNRVR